MTDADGSISRTSHGPQTDSRVVDIVEKLARERIVRQELRWWSENGSIMRTPTSCWTAAAVAPAGRADSAETTIRSAVSTNSRDAEAHGVEGVGGGGTAVTLQHVRQDLLRQLAVLQSVIGSTSSTRIVAACDAIRGLLAAHRSAFACASLIAVLSVHELNHGCDPTWQICLATFCSAGFSHCDSSGSVR